MVRAALVNAVGGHASGGLIPGYAPGKDTVRAMLSPGEFVVVPRRSGRSARTTSTPSTSRVRQTCRDRSRACRRSRSGPAPRRPPRRCWCRCRAELHRRGETAAEAAGDLYDDSGDCWFSTAQSSVRTNVATPLAVLAGTTIPAAFAKSVPTWARRAWGHAEQ